MNKQHKSKGVTLLEIVISIAILGMMGVIFINMFGNSFCNVLLMGNKSKAVEKAQGFIEKAWESRSVNVSDGSIHALDGISKFTSSSDLLRYEFGCETKYCTKVVRVGGINYYKLSVAVFYKNGKKSVVISSLIPNGGI